MSLLEVAYNQIDIEIRYLVWLMNQFPGIRTVSSCAGHVSPSPGAGVEFTVERQADLAALMFALPEVGWRGGFVVGFPQINQSSGYASQY